MQPILDHRERGEYITKLWQQYRAGKIDADQMLVRQNEVMPTCAVCHTTPSIAWTPDGYICSGCYIAQSKDSANG